MSKLKDLINDNLEVSVSQFCRKIGLSRQTIDNIMHDRHEPSLVTVKRICKYFGVDWRNFVE